MEEFIPYGSIGDCPILMEMNPTPFIMLDRTCGEKRKSVRVDVADLVRLVRHGLEEDHWFGSGWMDFTWPQEQALVEAGWARRGLSGGLYATPDLVTALERRRDG